jgi:hypothetical protein
VPDGNPARAHMAGQARKPEAASNVSAEVDDEAITTLTLQILDCVVQGLRKRNAESAGKEGDSQETNV